MKKLVLAAAALALAAPATAAADPAPGSPIADQANCVAWFTTTLGHAGVAGAVISNGAQAYRPFGQNIVTRQLASERGSCEFDPAIFLP